jgi:FAD/FMN-containing dehydrogenase
MRGLSVDPVERIARAEAGVRMLDVVQAAAQHGLAPLAGTSGGIGVVGYTLGGGLSLFGRTHGLAATSVRGIEFVTADGASCAPTATTSRSCSGRCVAAAAASAS